MRSIYIILTRSKSIISRIIGTLTNEPFTHASIMFEDELPTMYSFARKYARLPLPAGLTKERLDRGFYFCQGDIPCALLRLRVPDAVYYRAKNRVDDMMDRQADYKYSIFGLIMCKFSIPYEFPNKYFCSQFVSKVISECGAASIPKPPALMHPCDFLSLSGANVLFRGGSTALWNILATNAEILHAA